MKLSFFLFFISINTCFAAYSYSQTTNLSLDIKNKTVKDVFSEIEKKSEFVFFYQDGTIDLNRKVSIKADKMTVDKILNEIFKSTNNTYEIANRQIYIHKSDNPSPLKENYIKAEKKITGAVYDEDATPLIGVTVAIKGTTVGVLTDTNGGYSINVPDNKAVLQFTYIGFETQEIVVGDRSNITVIMKGVTQNLEDIVIVGYGTQKKESLVSAISTINVKELKAPTSNLTTVLAGRIAGIISYQRSGEPGQDNAEFFIRGIGTFGAGKRDPLILIDGIESSNTDLARLQPDDISDFSVLKDATAAAVYGARGANGVILVNTKQGAEGKTNFSFRVENSISTNTQNFKMVDNITYMELANEAALTRNPLSPITYSQAKIDYTKAGINPLLYPSNDWIDLLIKPYTMNQRYNMSISGGGRAARYYVSGTFNVDNGVLKNDNMNNFQNNVKLKNYSIRSNTILNLTKSTEATVRVYGQFDDYGGPIGGGQGIFNSALKANPVAFPVVYPSSMSPYTKHIMFGSDLVAGSNNTLYANPYASMVSGFQRYSTSTFNAQVELKQNFDFILKGLSLRGMGYIQRYARFASHRNYNPFFYRAKEVNGEINLVTLNDGGASSVGTVGTEYLNYTTGDRDQENKYYGEVAVNYNQVFDNKHTVGGMVIGTLQHAIINYNTETLESSLPRRNLGLAGRFSYMYDARYLLEFNFGYNGSERFAKSNRWGFFPSIGGGWILSNESFFEPLRKKISNLKIRASYGLVGNDQIGNSNDRFFYMSNVNLSDNAYGSSFGQNFTYHRPGISISRYENEKIGWEKSKQTNLGLDLTAFDLTLTVDGYIQKREGILMGRTYIPGTLGLQLGVPMTANIGKAQSSGVDIALNYNKSFNNSMWTELRANFTYATNEVKVYDEPDFVANEYYRSHVGYAWNTEWGYIAERLFTDDQEVANSPAQIFGSGRESEYGAGDIKYRDVNSDGVINEADKVPIGYPTVPEITYGFGGSFGYKNFDISAFFQGSARSSFFIDPTAISPFVQDGGHQNGLLKVIVENHWSEDNRNLYAFWPRLSDIQNNNNNQRSTWWMRNGAFLRLKNVEVGYNVPQKMLRKIGLSNCRIYGNATNLFVLSKFKAWDPEMGGNGLGYPVQRVYNIGISFGI
ncbi:TonB-dependent receptor [Dysgonomonas termitidis]|uniref:TonB-dependent receptor n=2 Tax=Dysgonomonas termitidis TaxID=1516126 RepID=A0ABV9KR70_9BACT